MNRIQLACYCLIASAFVLAALLVANIGPRLGSVIQPAEAGLVIAKNNFTFLTARARAGDEALFVIDNFNEQLLIYSVDAGRKRMDVANVVDLSRLFAGGGAIPPGGGR
jgi:hypothetical protein